MDVSEADIDLSTVEPRSSSPTLVNALRILADDANTEEGLLEGVLLEAAARIEELEERIGAGGDGFIPCEQFLAETVAQPQAFDPTPPANCKACGRPTLINRCDSVPICEQCRKADEALRTVPEPRGWETPMGWWSRPTRGFSDMYPFGIPFCELVPVEMRYLLPPSEALYLKSPPVRTTDKITVELPGGGTITQ